MATRVELGDVGNRSVAATVYGLVDFSCSIVLARRLMRLTSVARARR